MKDNIWVAVDRQVASLLAWKSINLDWPAKCVGVQHQFVIKPGRDRDYEWLGNLKVSSERQQLGCCGQAGSSNSVQVDFQALPPDPSEFWKHLICLFSSSICYIINSFLIIYMERSSLSLSIFYTAHISNAIRPICYAILCNLMCRVGWPECPDRNR